MDSLRLLACILLSSLLVACGGGDARLESERNAYGYTVAAMQSAPASAPAAGKVATLFAQASQTTLPGLGKMRWNSSTNSWDIDPSSGDPTPVWLVGIGFRDEQGNLVKVDAAVVTLWVLRGNEFISSRNLSLDSGVTVAAAGFPNPPFAADATRAVVELSNSGSTQLVSAPIVWAP